MSIIKTILKCIVLYLYLALFWAPVLPAADSRLPSAPPPEELLSHISVIHVEQFVFSGNTVFTNEVLKEQVKQYEKRTITAEELQQIKNELTKFYIEKGYINSGIIIPDQKIHRGIVRLNVVEGRIDKVTITGNNSLKKKYVMKQIFPDGEEKKSPLNINHLRQRLKLLKRDPHIEIIHARLIPGKKPGLASLTVDLIEASRFSGGIVISNHASPGTGSTKVDAFADFKNITGNGDDITACAGASQGLNNYSLSYAFPALVFNTDLIMKFERTDSTIISKPFSKLDITGQSGNYSLEFKKRIYRSQFSEFLVGGMAEHLYSKTYIDETPFSFSEGAVNGESRLTAVRLSQEYIYRQLMTVCAVKLTFSSGLNAFDATMADTGPDAEFYSLQGQIRYIKRFTFRNAELHGAVNFQYADDWLLSLEKFSSGGADSVRGYRENYLTTDNGINASLEYRIPIAGFSLPSFTGITKLGEFSIIPFIDWGYGKDYRDNEVKKDKTILSAGTGFKWEIHHKMTAELIYGKALTTTNETAEHDLQDDGIHFKLQIQF